MINNDKYKDIDETKLWEEYKKTGNLEIREHFVKQYAPLVKYVAGKVAIGMPSNTEFDDLVSDGVIGLLDAIEKYEPNRGIKFKTYAVTRIRGAIFDGLRERDWIPRSIRQKAKEIENTIKELEMKLGRPAEDEEISSALGMSLEEFQKIMLDVSGTTVMSLNEMWHVGSEDESVSMMEKLEGPESLSPDVVVEKEEVKRVIMNAIESLPQKEKEVLVLYYYEDLTLKEIGEVLDVTESRVSQLHTRAIMRLKAKLSNYQLEK